jgi:Flp pilus assembly pilin Flp
VDENKPDVLGPPFHNWEWAIIIALVVIVAIAAYELLGPQISGTFTHVNDAI